jgi:D-sedoheptulose 7-phosphate isomerase
MSFETHLTDVIDSLCEVAELRRRIADEHGRKIVEAALLICNCLQDDGKVLLFGNGGSAADAQHIAAELVGRFMQERRALPAIAFTTDSSILTAVGNDYGSTGSFQGRLKL